jgi:hypothetical protein
MSDWIGLLPVIGTGSLEGFALGVLASGACFLALTAPRRSRGRGAAARYDLTSGSRRDSPTVRLAATVRESLTSTAEPADQLRSHREKDALSPHGAASALAGRVASPDSADAALVGRVVGPDAAGLTASADRGQGKASADRGPGKTGGRRARHPLGDPTSGTGAGPARPEVRRTPRHAAPAPSLGSKVSGLFGTRSLADDSRG